MGRWVEIRDPAAYEAALALARGSYQRAILEGWAPLSGSNLRATARKMGGYARSRDALLARLSKAGIPWSVKLDGPHKRKVLVIGAS